MNTYLRAPTLEMPDDVLDDLRNRAAADEDRVTAKLRPFANLATRAARSGRATPHFAVNVRVPAPRPPSTPALEAVPLADVTSAAEPPAAVDVRPPQTVVKRAVVIGLSFAVTLALGLALAI